MKSHYVTKVIWDGEDDLPGYLHHTTVDEVEPTFTGLLNADGLPLFRMPPPLGFHHPLD